MKMGKKRKLRFFLEFGGKLENNQEIVTGKHTIIYLTIGMKKKQKKSKIRSEDYYSFQNIKKKKLKQGPKTYYKKNPILEDPIDSDEYQEEFQKVCWGCLLKFGTC